MQSAFHVQSQIVTKKNKRGGFERILTIEVKDRKKDLVEHDCKYYTKHRFFVMLKKLLGWSTQEVAIKELKGSTPDIIKFKCLNLYQDLYFEVRASYPDGFCFYHAMVEGLKAKRISKTQTIFQFLPKINDNEVNIINEKKRDYYRLALAIESIIETFLNYKSNKIQHKLPKIQHELTENQLTKIKERIIRLKVELLKQKNDLPEDYWGIDSMVPLLTAYFGTQKIYLKMIVVRAHEGKRVDLYRFQPCSTKPRLINQTLYDANRLKDFYLQDCVALKHTPRHFDALIPLPIVLNK